MFTMTSVYLTEVQEVIDGRAKSKGGEAGAAA